MERKVRQQELELKKTVVAIQEKQAAQGQTQMQEMLRVMQQQQHESQHDSFANAATTTFYECHAKSS